MFHYEHPHPAVTVDVAVFRRVDNRTEIALIRRAHEPFRGRWALPGGFVGIDEGLEAAARRELAEETGLKGVELEQLAAFGDPDRDPRERVITVAYIAVLESADPALRAATDAAEAGWFGIEDLPALAFDHAQVIAAARRRIDAETGSGDR